MREAEFENRFNVIFKEKIIDDNLFSSGNFDNFYNDILNSMSIPNINEIVGNFYDQEQEYYEEFYDSVRYSYLLIYSFLQISKKNINILAQNILNSSKDIEDYLYQEMLDDINMDNFDIMDFIMNEHNKIVNESIFMNKYNDFVNSIKNQIMQVINDKKYLLNNISNNRFIDYIDNGNYLTSMDINILNLYLQNGRHDVLKCVSDEVFCKLSKDQIIDILKNSVNIRDLNKVFLDDLSSNKIQYILSFFDIKSIIEIDNNINLIPFFAEIKNLREEDLNYLIKKNKIKGIEECKYVVNNILYVKKIIKSGYDDIFKYLSLELIDDEILNSIDINNIHLGKDGNLLNLLKSMKIFSTFSRNTSDLGYLLYFVGNENITREMVLFCMLDGMRKDNDMMYFQDIADKVNMYYSCTLEDIRYALECGYKCSKSTILLSKEQLQLFLDNNQPEIIDYYNNLSFDTIKYATLKGHKFDDKLKELLFKLHNFNVLLSELVRYNIDNNNMEFCDSVLIYFASKLSIKEMDYLLNLYKDDPAIQKYLEFSQKSLYNINPKNREEIYKYFSSLGPTKELYDKALFDYELFGVVKGNLEFINSYNDDKSIINYINFVKNTYKWLNFKNKEEMYEYFNSSGPSDKFYDIALTDDRYFNTFLYHYGLKEHFSNDSAIINYINCGLIYNKYLYFYIKNKEEIYKYFNSLGPTKEFYDFGLFGSSQDLFNYIINHDLDNLENVYGDYILSYTDFLLRYGRIFDFINKDNISIYFNSEGVTSKLKEYLRDNNSYTKILLSTLVHNNQVINRLDNNFVNIFELYIIDEYFNGSGKEKYDYLLNNLGPEMLFNLDNENVLKLINLDNVTLKKFMETIKCCEYDIAPNNIIYNNIIVSLCNFTFKKENPNIINIFTNIKSIIMREPIQRIDDCFNDQCSNLMQLKLVNYIRSIICVLKCSKDELYKAIIDCKNLHEDSLHDLCRKYIEVSEANYLESHKDTIFNSFGIPLSYDRDDSIKKISTYFKNNMGYDSFDYYRFMMIKSYNWDDLKDNEFIDKLKMTKSEYNNILSITKEEFDLIISAIKDKKRPDDKVKDKFKLFNRFMNLVAAYRFDNEKIDDILHSAGAKKVSVLELQKIDMFQILKEMDIDIFINNVINNEDIMISLRNTMKNKFIGRLPDAIGDKFKNLYDLELPDGINNIGLFLTKYSQILDRKKIILKSQGIDIDVSKINLSFSEIVEAISAVNSATEEVKRLFESREYSDFAANPTPNKNNYNRKLREEKLVRVADYLYSVSSVTIPSKDFIIENNSKTKKINFIVGNRTNPSNICHGERTGACMRIGGVGEGLFLKCITDKNWFHIRIEDPETHEYISRVSGFRKGNSVFLNQLRDSCDKNRYSNNDLQEFITIYANQLIEETKDSKYPIENIFINDQYGMENYSLGNGRLYGLGYEIIDGYSLDDVIDLKLSPSKDIWVDVLGNALLLATTIDGKKNEDGFVPFKGGAEDTCVYDAVRDKIYGLEYGESTIKHQFVIVDNNLLMEKINRVHAMKEKLLGKDYRYEISDLKFDSSIIMDGYASSDFYVYIDSNYNIHSDYIENINKDGKIISYNQSVQAKNEMNNYIEVIKNRYNLMEVKHAI